MSSQIQITGETKVKSLTGVLTGTSGVVGFLPIDVSLGIPQLDVNGKILVSQLPNSVMEYKGTWDASTNTPTLANGTGNQGDVYLCNVAGTVNFGAGAIAFFVGDQVIYSGSIWQRASGATGTVTSVAITESGDSLNITGSPITTSGTINIGFNGTNLQYVNGAGNLTTFPTLTGYVPYTGATQDVDLGAFSLNGKSLHIKGTAGNGHLGLKHQSAAATGSANESLIYADTLGDLSWLNGNLYLSKFITSGNTAARSYTFPDATCNIPNDALVVHLAGTETITGAKTFSGYTTFTSTVDITSGLTFSNSGFTLVLQPPTLSVNRTVTLPNGTGTLALTSDIPSITGLVPYTGATTDVNLGLYSLTSNSIKVIGDNSTYGGTLSIKQSNVTSLIGVGYTELFGKTNRLGISFGAGSIALLSNSTLTAERTYTLPDATGTIALTSDLTGYLTAVTASSPLSSSGGTTPNITIALATTSASGYLSSTDWNTFNNKQAALTNPVTGTGTTNYLPKFTGTSTIGNSNLINDTSGNLGLGVTPSAWGSNFKVLQIGTTTGLWSVSGVTGLSNNLYNDGAGRYLTSDFATIFEHSSGQFRWLTAPSGTAGNAITFTQAMTLFANGGLGLNTTTPTTSTGYHTFSLNSSTGGQIEFQTAGAGKAFIYSNSTDLRFYTSGGAFRFENTTGLEVGYSAAIGLYKLDVNGTGRFSSSVTAKGTGNYNGFIADNSSSATIGGGYFSAYSFGVQRGLFGVAGAISGAADNNMGIFAEGGLGIKFFVNGSGTASHIMTSSGNVLIGTTTDAGYKLDVNGTGRFSGNLNIGGSIAMSGTSVAGTYLDARVQSAVTGNMVGYEVRMVALSPSSGSYTVANMYGIKTNTPVVQPNVTVTNSYGIYIGRTDDPSSGGVVTNKYALVTEANAGNVGIGTTSVSNAISGTETVLKISNSNVASLYLESTSGRNYALFSSAGSNFTIYDTTAGANRFMITSGGNVGINTASPISYSNKTNLAIQGAWGGQIDIMVGSASHAQFGSDNYASGLSCRIQSADGIVFRPSSGEAMRITSGGNVLIGTTDDGSGSKVLSYSTSAATQFKAAGTAPAITFTNTITSPTIGGVLGACTSANQFFTGTASGDMVLANQFSSGKLILGTNNVERLSITNGGNIQLVTASSSLSFFYTTQNTAIQSVDNTTLWVRTLLSGSGNLRIEGLAGTGSRAVLADSVGLLSAPVSDISVKQNIKPIGYGLSEIVKMNPVWFDFIDGYKNYGEGRQNGNIAQEMELIIPEAVFTTPSTGKMGINYDQLHAVYIKAIQELKAEIEELKLKNK